MFKTGTSDAESMVDIGIKHSDKEFDIISLHVILPQKLLSKITRIMISSSRHTAHKVTIMDQIQVDCKTSYKVFRRKRQIVRDKQMEKYALKPN